VGGAAVLGGLGLLIATAAADARYNAGAVAFTSDFFAEVNDGARVTLTPPK
jgi:hypothetical protein